MSERIKGSYDDALYKSTYTLLYFTLKGKRNANQRIFCFTLKGKRSCMPGK